MYRESAWIFIGGLNYEMSEGDVITVFSQYGEVVNINLVRDQKTGKSKGFCFLCYSDQRSTVLAVDNFNGIKLLNRTIRVDHVANYRMPKEHEDIDPITKQLYSEGCAPKEMTLPVSNKQEDSKQILEININIKNKKKRKHKRSSSESSDSSSSDSHSKRNKSKSKRKERESKYDKQEKSSSDRRHKSDRKYESSKYDRKKSDFSHKYDKEKSRSDSKSKYY
jgi:RNA-binding motif X-linked protein 2